MSHKSSMPALCAEFVKMNLIGQSDPFLQTLALIKQVANYDATVLLLGETGTGKELAARAMHYMGPRSSHPFIPVNCGALPDDIFENEVFGHEPGAYTDAKSSQQGLVGQACGGSLFLDEIDTLSLKAQVALLRFLQDQQYKPLGAQTFKIADVRIIAASNANLDDRVASGLFRQDLLYRLNLLPVTMPPLRERADDVSLLAMHFLERFTAQYGGPHRQLHKASLSWMQRYSWPGNVRELENTLHRAFLVSKDHGKELCVPQKSDHCETRPEILGIDWDCEFNEAKSLVVDVFEKRYLRHVLSKVDGNISRAAKLAGKERRTLGRMIKKHGLKRAGGAFGEF